MQQPRPGLGIEPNQTTHTPAAALASGAAPSTLQPVVSVPAPSDMRSRPKVVAPTLPAPRGLNVRSIAHGDITWIDILHPGEGEIEWLRRNYNFHPLYIEDTLSKVQRPKIDDGDDYTFVVMHFPVYSKLVRVTTPSEVDIFVGANYVITAHSGGLKPLTSFFNQCLQDPQARAAALGRSPGYLLYLIIDKLVDYCFPILNKIDQNIEQVEDEIFEEKVRRTIQDISVLRRDIIAFRRIIKPLIPVITSLERKARPWLHEDDVDDYFGDLSDHLSRIWDALEEYKEVIEALSDTLNTLTSHRSNETIRRLTIISVILLPLTLVSGLFGQNVPIPFGLNDNPYAFTIILGIMALITLLMLIFFRWRRWI